MSRVSTGPHSAPVSRSLAIETGMASDAVIVSSPSNVKLVRRCGRLFGGKHVPQDPGTGQPRKTGCGGRFEQAWRQGHRRGISANDVDLANTTLERALGGFQL